MINFSLHEICLKHNINAPSFIDEKTLVVEKWNWDYLTVHSFQKDCVELIKKQRDLKVFIFCSHPHCFTNGRGLQKRKGTVASGLVPFDESLIDTLPYPCHKIERGGGLSFHYPGQWIFYPIINLTNKEFTLPELMNWTLESLQKILNAHSDDKIDIKLQEKAGLWRSKRKIASLGFALDRFITYHGLALNLDHDPAMFSALLSLNPCGLNPDVYQSYNLAKKTTLLRSQLQSQFIKSLTDRLSH